MFFLFVRRVLTIMKKFTNKILHYIVCLSSYISSTLSPNDCRFYEIIMTVNCPELNEPIKDFNIIKQKLCLNIILETIFQNEVRRYETVNCFHRLQM